MGVVLDLMDRKSLLSLGCASTYAWEFSGTTSEARCEAETSFSSLAFTVLLGARWDPKFLEQKHRMSGQICLCSHKYVRSPLPALQPLPQRTKRSMFWLEK